MKLLVDDARAANLHDWCFPETAPTMKHYTLCRKDVFDLLADRETMLKEIERLRKFEEKCRRQSEETAGYMGNLRCRSN